MARKLTMALTNKMQPLGFPAGICKTNAMTPFFGVDLNVYFLNKFSLESTYKTFWSQSYFHTKNKNKM